MTKWKVEEAYAVLKKEPVMKRVIKNTGLLAHGKQQDVYFALLKSITSQQLSVKAGSTIFGRFLDLFPGRIPDPVKVGKINIEKLRGAGLSYAKAGYLKNIAKYNIETGLDFKKLNKMNDDELLEYLTAIKGVGKWTAEMILMFTMNRPDILPVDDLGIRNEMKHLYSLKGEGKKLNEQMHAVATQWQPYRTLACRHLWLHRDAVTKAPK